MFRIEFLVDLGLRTTKSFAGAALLVSVHPDVLEWEVNVHRHPTDVFSPVTRPVPGGYVLTNSGRLMGGWTLPDSYCHAVVKTWNGDLTAVPTSVCGHTYMDVVNQAYLDGMLTNTLVEAV